jgi:Tfp pilus assembly protein PilO
MSSSRHLVLAVFVLAALTSLGGLTLVWPCYRDAAEISRQAEELRRKNEQPQPRSAEIARLAAEQEALDRRIRTGFKLVPKTADLAALMQALSIPVDRNRVGYQTMLAGEPREAAPGSGRTMVQPLTVEMDAQFDAVFQLLQTIEAQPRLLRVSSVRIACEGGQDEGEARPLAKATVVVEAMYEPPAEAP